MVLSTCDPVHVKEPKAKAFQRVIRYGSAPESVIFAEFNDQGEGLAILEFNWLYYCKYRVINESLDIVYYERNYRVDIIWATDKSLTQSN